MPTPLFNFEGISNVNSVLPPDTNGDVGRTHYVQTVNLSLAVWDITTTPPTLVLGPVNINSLWTGFGGICETNNDGDPIVLYDHLADRWMVSQFALNFPNDFHQCIAISQTGDPTGGWYLYDFLISTTKMNDYPKFGLWPDGWYMSINQFDGSTFGWAGAGAVAFERDKMLNGQTAQMVYFDDPAPGLGGMLPTDLDGDTLPPTGAPNYFVQIDDGAPDQLQVWEFHVDWTNPANSTFTQQGTLPTAAFDSNMCGYSRSCIPQPDTTQGLDALSDRLMYRLVYRNFGSYQAMVVNHTVDATGADQAGIRWYELRNTGGGWSIYQQGTYTGDAANDNHRWMGSIAMDREGNIALGYSVSGDNTYPSIRYTGRLASDPLNALPQGETEIIAGSGSQTHSAARWGDYSAMSIAPDGCTFWYTQEYVQTTGSAPWQTRIASFSFPNCQVTGRGMLQGTVTDSTTNNPIPNATVTANLFSTSTDSNGLYRFPNIFTGTYTVTVMLYGYNTAVITGVTVTENATTTQNFALTPLPMAVISGTVTDADTGWPLYARLDVSAPGGYDTPFFTNPTTGFYSATLAQGITHTFAVESIILSYTSTTRSVILSSGGNTENFALQSANQACPSGYNETLLFYDGFEAGTLGASWSITTTNEGRVQVSTYEPYNGTYSVLLDDNLNGSLYSSAGIILTQDMTGLSNPLLDFWWHEYSDENNPEDGVFISDDGGATWCEAFSFNNGPSSYQNNTIDLANAAASCGMTLNNNFKILFRFYDNYSIPIDGYTIDEVKLLDCTPAPGGLVVGNVYDNNTGLPLNGVTVSNDDGRTTTTFATPDDPNVDDGFYALFSPPGSHSFTATLSAYTADVRLPTVVQSDTIRQDFHLDAGLLSYNPSGLNVTINMGMSATLPLTLTNSGGVAAMYEFLELDSGRTILGPIEAPQYVVKPFKQNYTTTKRLTLNPPPAAPPYAAGNVLQTWPTNLTYAWGLGYNTRAGDLWLGNLAIVGGDDLDYRYLTDGTNTGDTIDISGWVGAFAADITYNTLTGMLWQVDVGGDNCIHELDPVNLTSTGNTICPAFAASQRGLAYDPITNVYFAGSWNDQTIYRFAPDGTILQQVNVGLAIAGLAYNPNTAHLFVMTNAFPNDIYVLDAANNFALVGQFSVAGFSYYGGAGFAMACDGSLWAVDQKTQTVYQIDSGEITSLCTFDVPWLNETPISGTIGSLVSLPITATFDASVSEVDQPGTYYAQLVVQHDTPYQLANIPVVMTVTAPASWGKLTGTVNGLETCDIDPAPLQDATVLLQSGTGMTWSLTTDISGTYRVWLDEANSPLTATISAAGYATQTVTGITVTRQMTTTQVFTLRLAAPCLSATPDSLSVTVSLGMSATLPLTLTNSGAGATYLTLQEQDRGRGMQGSLLFAPQNLSQIRVVAEEKGLQASPADGSAPHPALKGGADGFGYTFIDSTEPGGPTYNWIEIAPPAGGNGTTINLNGVDDGYAWPIALPFPFDFYGTVYTRAAIASNGTIYFEDDYLGLSNAPIPSFNLYGIDTFIAHYWDDLYVWPGEVYYAYDPTNEAFIIEYYQVSGCCLSPNAATWEVILFQNGNILFQYQDASFGDYRDYGGSATVGIQGNIATGLEYTYNTAVLTDSLAICFVYPGQPTYCGPDVPWLSENPTTGALAADAGSLVVDITFDASVVTQTGRYYATLWTTTDHPAGNIITVPVTMTVSAYGITISPPVASSSSDPGTTVTHTLRMTNTGSVTDTFGLTLKGNTWNVTAPATIGPLPPGASMTLSVTVNIPANVAGGAQDETTVQLTSQGNEHISTQTVLTTRANKVYGTSATSTDTQIGQPGNIVTHTLTLTNTGNTTDTFTVVISGNVWPTSLPLPTLQTPGAAVVLGPLGAGASDTIAFIVAIPKDALAGQTDAAHITFTSQNDNTKSAVSTLTTTVQTGYAFEVAPATAAASNLPGLPVFYTLAVQNIGTMTDSYTLTVRGKAWPVSVTPTSLGPLNVGDSANLVVQVNIPTNTLAGATNSATVTVTSQNKPSLSVQAVLTTTAKTVYSLTLNAANKVLSGTPGSTVTYTLIITNLGNITDTYTITAQSTWLASIPATTGPVVPGERMSFNVIVNVPTGAAAGEINATDVTVTSSGGQASTTLRLTTEARTSTPPTIFLPLIMKP